MEQNLYAAAERHRRRRIRIAVLLTVLLGLPLLCYVGLRLYLAWLERSQALISGIYCGMTEDGFLTAMSASHADFSLSDRVTAAEGGYAYLAYCDDAEVCGVHAPVLLAAEFRASNGTLQSYSASLLCGDADDESALQNKAAMMETLSETLPARFGSPDPDREMIVNPFYERTGFAKLWSVTASDFVTEGGFAVLNSSSYGTEHAALPQGYSGGSQEILDILRESAHGIAFADVRAFLAEMFFDA